MAGRKEQRKTVDVEGLVAAIRQKLDSEGLSLRGAQKKSGVNYNTLSQITINKRIPTYEHFQQLCDWLGHPMSRYLRMLPPDEGAIVIDGSRPTPDSIEELLGKDQNLTPEAARALSNIFREGYDFFIQGGGKGHVTTKKRRNHSS